MPTQKKSSNTNGHGGARPGAGRPKGSGHKVNLEDLMMDLELETHMPYTQRLAINYSAAIQRSDWARVENYDRAFLNKLVSDRQTVEVIENADLVEAKRLAFADAVQALTKVTTRGKE